MTLGVLALALFSLCGDSPLVNPGFDARAAKGEVPGWTIIVGATNGANAPLSRVELDTKEKKSGRASLHLSGDESTRAWQLLQQDVPVRVGGRYTLEARVRTEGVRPNGFGLDNCYVGLIFFDANDQVAGRDFRFPERDQPWTTAKAELVAPPTARRASVYIFLSMIGDLWVDDLELTIDGGEALPEPEQILFEDFSRARKLPRQWTREVGATSGEGKSESRVEVDREAEALKLEGDDTTHKWLLVGPELKAEEGCLYSFRAKVKARDVRAEGPQFHNLHLSLVFFDRKGEMLGKARFANAGEGSYDWKPIAVEAVSPEGTAKVRAGLFLSMSGTAWFDDVELSCLENVPVPYGDWGTVEEDGIVLRYSGQHPNASQMKLYALRLKQSKEMICKALEVEFPEPITVFVYKDLDEGKLLTGGALDFADPRNRKVHQRWNSFISHEMTHVIAHTTLTYSGTTMIGEGIAVWLDGRTPAMHHANAWKLLEKGTLPTVGAMLDDFRSLEVGYPAAGSFVGYLLEQHGLDVFKRLYPSKDPSAVLKEAVGQSFEDLEAGWHEHLRKFK